MSKQEKEDFEESANILLDIADKMIDTMKGK